MADANQPPPGRSGDYAEPLRPQFHFTARRNWLNDPNGLVWYRGEYHLFFQHNPTGINWGNMTWGHAVSRDLVRWRQLPHAIEPDALGTIFSGSAVVDWDNTAGFQSGPEPPLVAIYTSAGGTSPESQGRRFSQSLAYSLDRGRTWTRFAGNPVLPHIAGDNRDPKGIWHAPTRRWIMVLYKDGNTYALFCSPDLKRWTPLDDLQMPGGSECPDFFPMPVEGRPGEERWVFTAANGLYLVGSFDGRRFQSEGGPRPSDTGANFYAVQTWSDIPPEDGRRIQLAWMGGGQYPGMPFNQQMSFPCELLLRPTPEGLRLKRRPVREIETLHGPPHTWTDAVLRPGDNPLAGLEGELFDIRADLDVSKAAQCGFIIRGQPVAYSAPDRLLACCGKKAEWPGEGGRVALQILVDRTSIEVFGDEGLVSMTSCFLPKPEDKALAMFALGGPVKILSLKVYPLRSAWHDAAAAV